MLLHTNYRDLEVRIDYHPGLQASAYPAFRPILVRKYNTSASTTDIEQGSAGQDCRPEGEGAIIDMLPLFMLYSPEVTSPTNGFWLVYALLHQRGIKIDGPGDWAVCQNLVTLEHETSYNTSS